MVKKNFSFLVFSCLISLSALLTTAFAQKCKLVSLPSFDFGSLDKYLTDYTLKRYVTLWCAKDVEYKLTINNGTHTTNNNPSLAKDTNPKEHIPYHVSFIKQGVGQGKNILIRVPITIKIPAASQRSLPIGRYQDQIKITFSY